MDSHDEIKFESYGKHSMSRWTFTSSVAMSARNRAHKFMIENIYVGSIMRLFSIGLIIIITQFNYDYDMIYQTVVFSTICSYYHLVQCYDQEPLSQICDKYRSSLIKMLVMCLSSLMIVIRLTKYSVIDDKVTSSKVFYDIFTFGFDINYNMLLAQLCLSEYTDAKSCLDEKNRDKRRKLKDHVSQMV